MNIKVVGIDLAKVHFQICVLCDDQTVAYNKKIRREKMLVSLREFPPGTLVALEACGSANYWGRVIESLGLRVRLIPAQYVKAMARQHQKNDAIDALAICESALRPGIHWVKVKTLEQQDIKVLRCTRQQWVTQRTALANQIRGLSAEYGVIFPKKLENLRRQLMLAVDDQCNEFTAVMRTRLRESYEQLLQLDTQIKQIQRQLQQLCQTSQAYQRLLRIPGFGPLTCAAIVSEIGDGTQFKNGRQFSAWTGIVPKQHSSGSTTKLLGITKNGNRELRTLLIHGARALMIWMSRRTDALSRWVNALVARRGRHVAIVALANKMARIGWAVLTSGKEFTLNRAFAA